MFRQQELVVNTFSPEERPPTFKLTSSTNSVTHNVNAFSKNDAVPFYVIFLSLDDLYIVHNIQFAFDNV